MKKIIGYIIAAVGLLVLLMTFKQFSAIIPIAPPPNLSKGILTIISLVVIGIGLFLVIKFGSGNKKLSEVPIYHGKDVVGYRRLGK